MFLLLPMFNLMDSSDIDDSLSISRRSAPCKEAPPGEAPSADAERDGLNVSSRSALKVGSHKVMYGGGTILVDVNPIGQGKASLFSPDEVWKVAGCGFAAIGLFLPPKMMISSLEVEVGLAERPTPRCCR